jgi:hypothetical protein
MALKFGTLSATTSKQYALDVRSEYTFINNDLNIDVYIAEAPVAADGAVGEGSFTLAPGAAVVIGPGVAIINLASASGTPKVGYSSTICEASKLAANRIS